jgi:hypothetical protein
MFDRLSTDEQALAKLQTKVFGHKNKTKNNQTGV